MNRSGISVKLLLAILLIFGAFIIITVTASASLRIDNIPAGEYDVTELTVYSPEIEGYTHKTTKVGNAEQNVYTRDNGKLKIKRSFSFTAIDGSSADPALSEKAKETIKFTITGPDSYKRTVSYKDFTDGEYVVYGLPVGNYSVKETGYDDKGLIENYSFKADSSDVAVKSDLNVTAANTPVATFKNAYTEDYGYLNIMKTVKAKDYMDSYIRDKTFKITVKNAEGKYVSTEVDGNNNAVLKDNKKDAIISIKDGEALMLGRLAAGTYTVEEDQDAALAGDSEVPGITLEDKYSLEVEGTGRVDVTGDNKDSDKPAKVSIVNTYLERICIKIRRTDLDGNMISGAMLLLLTKEEGAIIDEWTSDNYNDHEVIKLDGDKTYILREIEAPDDYEAAADSELSFYENRQVIVDGTASVTTEGKIQIILVKSAEKQKTSHFIPVPVVPDITKEKLKNAENEILNMKEDKDPANSGFLPLKLRSAKQTKSSVTVRWNKPTGAVKYVVYGNKCGNKNKLKKIKTTKSRVITFKKIAGRKVKKGTYYKFIVVAVDKDNNVIAKSTMMHVSTKGGKVGNVMKLTIKAPKNAKKTLKVGNTVTIRAKQTKPKKLKVKTHVGLRYESSNVKVATVSTTGKIKAVGKGKCKVFVYAQNGLSKTVSINSTAM